MTMLTDLADACRKSGLPVVEVDGWRTRAIVRRHPDFHDLPMVMLSASDSAFEDPRGGEAGAPEHLVKPFTGEQLLDAVRRLARAPAGAGS